MDGFKPEDHVIVIAATNRVADLDEALIRPGRFDKHFHVPLPDKKTREELVQLYMKNKTFADDVDIDWVVAEVCGSSCAAIESILNEAALLAIQEHDKSGKVVITREMIETAIIKMEIKGHIKKDAQTNEKTKRITAYHEAGHTVATALLTDHELARVTILPSTSGVGGYTKSTQKENTLYTIEQVRHELMVLYAGRQAELVLAGHNPEEVTIGCSNDVERATQIIQNVANYSDFMGKGSVVDYTQFGNTGLEKSLEMAEAVSAQALKATEDFITEHWEQVDIVAKALLEKETLQGSEVLELLGK
jgi:cell division protease FtsH